VLSLLKTHHWPRGDFQKKTAFEFFVLCSGGVLLLATKSTRVRRRFLEVQQMLKTPPSLFHPALLIRIAWNALTSSERPKQPGIFKPKIEVRAKAENPIDAL